MKIPNRRISWTIIITLFLLTTSAGMNIAMLIEPINGSDFDPLVDIEVTVEIQKIRTFDKHDVQLRVNEYVDSESDPDFYVTVIINGEEFTSDIWQNTKYIYDPEWSATHNVPDTDEFVDITIQLWDSYDEGGSGDDKLCDISGDTGSTNGQYDVELEYSIKTGQWTGDDSIGDPSGYGRLNGCDDGTIYEHDRDCELWFTISQTDYDGDNIPYWMELNEYETDPEVNNTGDDYDVDNIPIEWEWRWGYDPFTWNDYEAIDPENDGINNYEEYLTSQWFSDPFRKDLFLELDQMESCLFPEGAKELLYTAYDRQNVVYHLDDGSWEGSGSDIIPFDEATEASWGGDDELTEIYDEYFLHGNESNWRLGVFRYGVVIHQSSIVNGNAFGSNRFQISSNGMEEKADIFFIDRDVAYASAYMHETGHTLGFSPIPGHNDRSKYPWQLGWWLSRPYISCMNYGYMYKMVDYSDGSRLLRDYDDWERMDLTYFQNSWD